MKKLTKEEILNILERMLKTFLEAIVAYLIATLPTTTLNDKVAVSTLVIGAIASGVSAILNLVQAMLKGEE